jgi:hypothetical protein
MKNEASDTTMLAVTVIALAVVVVIGFGIFQYARSILNTGSNNLTSALDSVNASAFTEYDQTTVSANQVRAAFQNFDGSAIAILVRTKALGVAGNTVKSFASENNQRYFISDSATTGTKVFINYNAILFTGTGTSTASSKAASGSTSTGTGVPKLTLADGVYRFSAGFSNIGGVITFYNVMTDINRTGMTEYIAAGSRFTSNLIKDDSGTVLGIVFEQK